MQLCVCAFLFFSWTRDSEVHILTAAGQPVVALATVKMQGRFVDGDRGLTAAMAAETWRCASEGKSVGI